MMEGFCIFFFQRTDITKVDLKSKSKNLLKSNMRFKGGKKITKKKKLIFGKST